MYKFEALSPAKINLFLVVTGKRSDGYHDLFSLMSAVTLYDKLYFNIMETKGVGVFCNHPDVPENEGNLAFTAATLFFNRLKDSGGRVKKGVTINIQKNIPIAAGLGGGSSNAATVLLVLNQFFNFPLAPETLAEIGLKVGADVPFFIYCKPAVAKGVGEKLTFYPKLTQMHIVLITPPVKVSTASVYKNLNLRLTKCGKNFNYPIFKKKGFTLKEHLCNDLETVAENRYPEISKAKEILKQLGAEGVLMTGSGPTVFGIFFDCFEAEKAKMHFADLENWKAVKADLIL